MAESQIPVETDKRVGFRILFSVFTLGGIIAMLADPGGLIGAWGFAIAVIGGMVLITIFHL